MKFAKNYTDPICFIGPLATDSIFLHKKLLILSFSRTIITVHTFYKTIVTGLFIQFVEFIYNPVYIEYKYSVTSDRTSPELNHH